MGGMDTGFSVNKEGKLCSIYPSIYQSLVINFIAFTFVCIYLLFRASSLFMRPNVFFSAFEQREKKIA